MKTALNINDIDESSLHWTSAKENLPCLTVNGLESYVKTRKLQAAQALQEKCYRIFASRKIVSVKTSVVHANKLLKAFVRPSMESKAARPLWILFSEDKPTKAFCRCPAGKSGLCYHVSTVLYALEEHSRTGNLTLEIACTSKLQTWHKNKPCWRVKLTAIDNIVVKSARKNDNPQQRNARTTYIKEGPTELYYNI